MAQLAALAFRQCLGAHKLVADHDGTPLMFFQRKLQQTAAWVRVDVTYPSSPFFLLFNPDLLEAMLTPNPRLCRIASLEIPLRSA